MHRFVFFLLCVLFSYFNKLKEVNSEQALLFSLKEITKTLDVNVTPCLTACPASTQQEKKFNDEISISGECLFLRDVYKDQDSPENIRLNVCHKPFKPVTIYNAKFDKYKIGYEVYFDEKFNDQMKITSAYECHYDQYESANVDNHNDITHATKPANAFYVKYVDGSGTKFKLADRSSTYVFFWIPVFSVDYSTHKVRIVPTYNARVVDDGFQKNITQNIWNITCDDYSLDDDEDMKELFFQKTQENCLKDIKTPSSSRETPSELVSCGQAFGCLEKSQIIPLWYFRARSTRLASCTRMNVIPVWKTIADGQLKKVDQHILLMLNFWRKFIKIGNERKFGDIIYGTTGVLKLPSKTSVAGARFGDDDKLREVYLSSTRRNRTTKMLVPKVIYRIVTVWWRGVAIIIHNNVGPVTDGDRMCSNASRVPGWEDIVNDDCATGLTYTCSLTQELDYKLGVNVFDHDRYMMLQGSQEQASRMLLSDYNKINARLQTEKTTRSFDF